ncbi:MAG TPA: PIG-L deacetylase family protein [Vicinamibacterales bacterium]|nr:PIG-L deacetylase family protein [Vicinamibacterales bacterium]
MSSPRRASVLALFAHPDDEIFSGGMLSNLSERGARVTLACATSGEAGKVHPSIGGVTDLGALRAEELRVSCSRLGIEPPVMLGFHDSGRHERLRRDDPRALLNADMLAVEAAIRKVIVEVKPQVIITFDPHGNYYHPDHLAVHRAATAAFWSSGMMGDEAPARLFYGMLTIDAFRQLAEASRGRGVLDDLDADIFAAAPSTIACSFDARPYVDRKLSAMAAHRSAFGLTLEMLRNPPPPAQAMLRAFQPAFEREDFVLGGTRGAIPHWPLDGLFDGLSTTLGARSNFSQDPAGAVR